MNSVLRYAWEDEATRADVPLGLFRAFLRLHEPLFVADSSPNIEGEISRLAQHLKMRIAPFGEWSNQPREAIDLQDCVFEEAGEEEARIVLERFHYLQAFRRDSRHFCLRSPVTDGSRIVALVTISDCDLNHVVSLLPFDLTCERCRVVSRICAFDWAPRNSISYLLAHVNDALRRAQQELRLLLTYVNPNIGFTGASYRASNWVRLGRECGTHYHYLDRIYITDRELALRYGSADFEPLRDVLGHRIQRSPGPLDPLLVFGYWMNARTRRERLEDLDMAFDVREWKLPYRPRSGRLQRRFT